ncbi:NAD(P)H-dependent oxidoreductase [Pontibacter sp. G13]|uniref:flavodoxin family protein n=1 Tax=Pontibacter sp. G13 TaxID=3074898 RepID=UPI0028894565|nr:NAD(P)H-dependent oxidoreductase [Pontibacter sp. G13]WNJ16986.1 NAD(P)H-dependent oxidoreductase [Pontibacter sp. G13]
MQTCIILGSARSDGHTAIVAARLAELIGAEVIDLNQYQIGFFDYDQAHESDDFLPLIRRISQSYDHIILASPVYWYTMSAQLKTFLDRFSDLLKWHKDLGRDFRGKSLGFLSCMGSDGPPQSLDEPIRLSAEYLGMDYLGHVHAWLDGQIVSPEADLALRQFADEWNTRKPHL